MKVGISVEKEEKKILFVKEGNEIYAERSVYLGRKGGRKQQYLFPIDQRCRFQDETKEKNQEIDNST